MAKKNGNGNNINKIVNIKYSKFTKGQFNDEVIVTLDADTGIINMILPTFLLDEESTTIKGLMIGQKEDSYLINLPNDTFTTGPNVWFPKSQVVEV